MDTGIAESALGRRPGDRQARWTRPGFAEPRPVRRYVRPTRAVLSSQIEGTQSGLDDILAFEVDAPGMVQPADITETVNYVRAMNAGLRLLNELPLSGRLIRAVHKELLTGVPGQERHPGEFRRSQNWIGPAGCTLDTASFVPPPPGDLSDCFGALVRFLHDHDQPPLVLAGLAHAQFESFTAVLRRNDRERLPEQHARDRAVTPAQRRVLDALKSGPLSAQDLATRLQVSPDFVRKSLRVLMEQGLALRDGGPGQRSTLYRRS